jgi:hypothetical protein
MSAADIFGISTTVTRWRATRGRSWPVRLTAEYDSGAARDIVGVWQRPKKRRRFSGVRTSGMVEAVDDDKERANAVVD